jgi:hypothetical protein
VRANRIEAANEAELSASSHYVAVPVTVRRALIPEENGRRVARRGMIYPSNDGEAIGVLLAERDVTLGDAESALLVHGLVFAERLPEAPSAEAKEALQLVLFVSENRLPAR